MTVDIARDRSKTLKIEKKKNEKWENVKQQLFTFTFLYRKIYILLKTYLEKLSLYCYICITVFSKWQVVGNAVTPTLIYILIVFAVTILRSKILDNGLGILT